MRFPLPLLLLLSLLFFLLPTTAWEENEPGFHEVTHFDWLIRENERAMSVSISGKVESESLSLGEGEGDVKELKGDVCTVYDLKFWEEVLRSEKQLSPSVTRFQNHPYFDLFIFQNVSISSKNTKVPVNKAQWTGGTPAGTPEFIDSKLSFEVADESLSFPMGSPHVQSGFLGSVSGIGKNKLEQKCQRWVDDPLFILASFDPANWFHFVERAVIPSFTYFGVAQPYFSTRNIRIATLRWPAREEKNRREKEIYPTWNALPEVLEKMLGGKLRVVPKHPFTHERRGGECYRTVAWGLADKLFLNIQNLNQLLDKTHGKGCFSPIVRSAADVVRSVMGVPYVRGPLPVVSKLNTTGGFVEVKTVLPLRVVFMKRSQGEVWTRHQGMRGLANQDEVIDFLRRKCKKNGLEFEALEFYYTDMKNAQEQIRAISRATVMVGIHGAGLAGMVALPPGSAVVELRLRNANLRDNHFVFMAKTMGHNYLQVRYTPPSLGPEQMELLWDTIAKQTQIDELAARITRKKRHPKDEREKESFPDRGMTIERLRMRREERRRERQMQMQGQ